MRGAGSRPADGGGGGGGGPPTGAAGGDLAGTYPNPTVGKLAGDAIVQYAATIYVDTNGDASSSGTNPATPTTLANALATAGFSTNVIISEGTYTTGAPITIPADNITLTARQGGTQSNSVIIQDQIVLGAGRTRFRAYGIRFDGGFADTSDGRHYVGSCSAGGGTYTRTDPKNFVIWTNCDFASLTYVSSGTGIGSILVVEGAAATLGPFTAGASGAFTEIHDATTQRLVVTAGAVELRGARVIDATLGINASAGSTILAYRAQVTTSGGTPVPITVDDYTLNDVIYDAAGSTLGAEVGTPTEFAAGIRRTLRSLLPATTRNTTLAKNTPPGVTPYAGAEIYLTYGPVSVDVTKTYRGILSLFTEVSANNTEYWFEVFVDATPLSAIPGTNVTPSQQPLGSAGSVADVGGNIVIKNFATGTYTLTVRVARGAGSGTVSYRTGSFEIFEEIDHG